MKTTILIFILLLLLVSCKDGKDYTTMAFANDSAISNELGIPHDSASLYFPEKLFYDSLQKPSIDVFNLKTRSFMLYKMKEPVLSNFYLNKKIYRLIVLRSFNKPLIIRIDKYADSVICIVKELNRHIMYPFMVYSSAPKKGLYNQSAKKLETRDQKWQIRDDSLTRHYNNTNCYTDLELCKKLTDIQWDSISMLIDSTKLWSSKPDVALNYLQIDGSNWIIEGHCKYGYQIKDIPSPIFDRQYTYENKFDKKNHYRNLFEYLIKISGLKNERLY